jgi:hypothetical protein
MPIERHELLAECPCMTCDQPQAEDVRAWLRNCEVRDLAGRLTPNNTPLGCCRVQIVGVVPGSQGAVQVKQRPPYWPR